MVNKFFSGKLPDSSKNGEELEEHFDIYHQFITAYPASTVERIETELSWRQVRLLQDQWGEQPPVSIAIARIEKMLEIRYGITRIPMKLQTTQQEVMHVISQTGMSA